MPTIKLTEAQAWELRDVLQREIDHLTYMVGDSSHPDDIDDIDRKAILEEVFELLKKEAGQ
jgi:hypothetical protein